MSIGDVDPDEIIEDIQQHELEFVQGILANYAGAETAPDENRGRWDLPPDLSADTILEIAAPVDEQINEIKRVKQKRAKKRKRRKARENEAGA